MKFTKTVKNLFNLIKTRSPLLVGFTILISLASILEALGVGILYPLMGVLGNKAKSLGYVNWVNEFCGWNISIDQFVNALFAGVIFFFLLRGLFIVLSYRAQYKLTENLRTNFQARVFINSLEQEYDYFIRHRTGDLMQKQMDHTDKAADAVLYSCHMARNVFTTVFLYIMLLLVSAKWALCLTGVMVIIACISLIVSKVKIYAASQEHAELQKEAYSILGRLSPGYDRSKLF